MAGWGKRGRGKKQEAPEPEPEQPAPDTWTLEIYETTGGSCPFDTFVESLSEEKRLVLDAVIRNVLLRQGHNVCGTRYGKHLGQGLYELRIDTKLATIYRDYHLDVPPGLNAHAPILLRVFFAVKGARIVVLFGGYDKGADPGKRRQGREIKRARKMLADDQEQEKERQRRK